jgi:hypothetical protein
VTISSYRVLSGTEIAVSLNLPVLPISVRSCTVSGIPFLQLSPVSAYFVWFSFFFCGSWHHNFVCVFHFPSVYPVGVISPHLITIPLLVKNKIYESFSVHNFLQSWVKSKYFPRDSVFSQRLCWSSGLYFHVDLRVYFIISKKHPSLTSSPEDGSISFLRNVCMYLTSPCCVTTQKTITEIFTAVETSDLIFSLHAQPLE